MTDKATDAKNNIRSKLALTMTLTGRLRWLKSDGKKTLQQEYRNVFTGEMEWRDVETVTQDKAE